MNEVASLITLIPDSFPVVRFAAGLPILAAITLVAGAVGCSARDDGGEVVADIVAVAPPQMVAGMSITPSLDTVHDAPGRGQVALSMDLQFRPAERPVELPRVGFRAWREGRNSARAAWEFPLTDIARRRSSDTLGAGETTSYGLTTSPGTLLESDSTPGEFRIEAVLRDRVGGEQRVLVGRVRIRRP